jgi:hypothetical protein
LHYPHRELRVPLDRFAHGRDRHREADRSFEGAGDHRRDFGLDERAERVCSSRQIDDELPPFVGVADQLEASLGDDIEVAERLAFREEDSSPGNRLFGARGAER